MMCEAIGLAPLAWGVVGAALIGAAWVGMEWRHRVLKRRGEAILASMDQFWADLNTALDSAPAERRGAADGEGVRER